MPVGGERRGSAAASLLDGIRETLPDRHHDYFDQHRRRYQSTLELVDRVAVEGELLDLGAAPFHFTALLQVAGFSVIAVDLEPARHFDAAAAFGIEAYRCDIERMRLPFVDGGFACVTFMETFEHLRIDPLFALAEVNRVMMPGGILVMTTPNLYAAQNIARFALGRGIGDGFAEFNNLRRVGHMGHIREYTRAELQRFLAASGFAIREHRFADYSVPRGRRQTAKFLAARLLPRRLRSFHEIVAEKVAPAPALTPT